MDDKPGSGLRGKDKQQGTLRDERNGTYVSVNDENVRTGQQETNEPWNKPDKSDHHPDKESPNPRSRRPEDNNTS